jgi:hypothetical protein
MARRNRGTAALTALLAVIVLVGGAWLFRDHIPGLGVGRTHVEVSPEAAAAAEEKLRRLQEDDVTARLTDVELTSYLRYRTGDVLAGVFHEPMVTFDDEQMRVAGRFPTENLPEAPELDRVRGLLPDTADIVVSGRLRTLPDGRAVFRVESASFARIPIPREMYERIFERMGRGDEPGLTADEFPFPLPNEVGAAAVEDGVLVLTPAG